MREAQKTGGNNYIHSILTTYIDTIKQSGTIPVPFLLLVGPAGLGKMDVAIQAGKSLVEEFLAQDALILKDYSVVLEKPHTLKVSAQNTITLPDGSLYEDIGMREVAERMVKSPAGQYKVLVIEDIERMTDSAANALLKIFEEPLPGRVIIGTTSQQSLVLPTILSRALLFSFYPVVDEVIDTYIDDTTYFHGYDREFLHAIATGRVGVLTELSEKPEAIGTLYKAFDAFTHLLTTPKKTSVTDTYLNIVPVFKAGDEKLFLQSCIYYASKRNLWDYVTVLQTAYSLLDMSINNEHILFDLITHINAISRS